MQHSPFVSHPNAIGAELQHLQTCEVLQIRNAANFVVKQKKFLQPSQLLQTLHLPQNVKWHVKLPVGCQNNSPSQNKYTLIRETFVQASVRITVLSHLLQLCEVMQVLQFADLIVIEI